MNQTHRLVSAVDDLDDSLDLKRFRDDVIHGLRAPQKELPCQYFYDERGSHLFDQICKLDEYYLTRTELKILRTRARAMSDSLGQNCLLIEFGSGSGLKTRILLDHLIAPAGYVPVDVSHSHLMRSARALAARYPGLDVQPACADFTRPIELPRFGRPIARRCVFFPGSTIGNFGPDAATDLLRSIATLCGPGGGLLIGVDLEKDPDLLEPAYNDQRGVTAAFNRNLLVRINRELEADFPVEAFQHQAFFNPAFSRIEMHLVAQRALVVHVDGVAIAFKEGESIRTEYSYKYRLDQFHALTAAAGFRADAVWTDEQKLFSVQYLVVE